jgi:hypothetical protein
MESVLGGEDVGLLVWSKAKSYFNGKAIPRPKPTAARSRCR